LKVCKFLKVCFVFLTFTFTNFSYADVIGMRCIFQAENISNPSKTYSSNHHYFKLEKNYWGSKFYQRRQGQGEWKQICSDKKGRKAEKKEDSIRCTYKNYKEDNITWSGEFLYDFQLRNITGQLQVFTPEEEVRVYYHWCSKFEDVF